MVAPAREQQVSVINKMLQDLDRRQASAGAAVPPPHVHVVKPQPERRIAFWAALGILVAAGIGWAAWVGYQLAPRPLATPLAFKVMDEARSRQVTIPVVTPPAPAPAPVAPAPAPTPEAPPPAPQVEMLRLAESIATPILESKPPEPAKPAAAPKPQPPKPVALPKSQAIPAPAKAAEKPRLERREIVGTPGERAENEFRHAVGMLKLGRSSEAEAHFARALELDVAHRGARQALIAMHIERGQLEHARRLLQDGLAIDPGQPEFAIALARIHVERKDLSGALAVLERSLGAAADVPEFHVLRGTLLQRLGRHADAVEAYQTGLQARATLPQAWVGLGISLEALKRGPEAADAFRRALAAGPVSAEVKTFAEQRIRALR